MRRSDAVAAIGALFAAALVGHQVWLLGPIAGGLLSLPLLWPLLALARRRNYGAAASSLLVLFYIGGWLIEFRADRDGALVAAVLAAALFSACLVYVKWAAAEARAAHAARTAPTPDDVSR